jgi:hypothetical protein
MIRDLILSASREASIPTIGEAVHGGYFAGVMSYGADWYLLIVSPAAASVSMAVRSGTTGSSDSVYDGLANSLATNDATHPAVQHCRSGTWGGFNDWYLGAALEYELAYRNLKPTTSINNASSGVNPWSVPAGVLYTESSPPQTEVALFVDGAAQAFTTSVVGTSTEINSTNNSRVSFTSGLIDNGAIGVARYIRPLRRVIL